MSWLEDVLAIIGVLALAYFLLVLGWVMAARDAEARLRGKKPVDRYWRARGMRALLLAFVLVGAARGQQPTVGTFTGTAVQSDDGWIAGLVATPTPTKNAHDYALSIFKAHRDYVRAKNKDGVCCFSVMSYVYAGPEGEQTFTLGDDDKLVLHNLSLEDAVLLLLAEEVQREWDREKEWDALEAARLDKPPAKFKVGTQTWVMDDQPDWSNNRVLGDTNCNLRRVRTLETDYDKRGTVMHELMHVATGCRDDKALHHLITETATPLVKLLRDNPDIAQWLLSYKPKPVLSAIEAGATTLSCDAKKGDELSCTTTTPETR